MKVLLFAQCRAAAGSDHCHLEVLRPIRQLDFWNLLIEAHPALAPFAKTARLARGESYLRGDEVIQPDDEIAIIPPVSGG